MNLSAKPMIILSVAGLLVSIGIHLLAVLNIYLIPNSLVFVLTAGALLAWLQSSRNMKTLHQAHPDLHPWKAAFKSCPPWLKYLTYFLFIYALFNFAMVMSFKGGDGYLNFIISQKKLRGLSGFWIAFYGLGLSSAMALRSDEKNMPARED